MELHNTSPWFRSGFCDAEGCFHCSITEKPNLSIGWETKLMFSIPLHEKDYSLLTDIQKIFFGVGIITKYGKNSYSYVVTSSLKKIFSDEVIINHFYSYLLISQKD